MGRDLYLVDLSTIAFADVTDFLGWALPEPERTREGWRLDYKADVPKNLGELVAAFSNTFGGLILLGVDERDNCPVAISGIAVSRGDLKTRLVNMIVDTVHPTPLMSVSTVRTDVPDRQVAVVRIEEGDHPPYLWTHGGESKIPVRREDRSKAVGPLELEALINRRRSRTAGARGIWAERDGESGFVALSTDATGSVSESEAYLRLSVRPERFPSIPIHEGTEERVARQLSLAGQAGLDISSRGSDDFELRRSRSVVFNARWKFYAGGELAFATEILQAGTVYLPEMVFEYLRALRGVVRVLEGFDWYGRVAMYSVLQLGNASVDKRYAPRADGPPLRGITTLDATPVVPISYETASLEYSALVKPSAHVARSLNYHLRTQRRAVIHLDRLTASIEEMWASFD
jgi:hypothetical protein